ncbi:MAG: hypothetical protein M1818_000462 [Claussenomyces sp. TS43310]|nr:MAG: hypothetical protein M1818_000462 [Claussenomyces sp. TS43310]
MAYEDDDSHSRRRQRRSIGSDDGRHRGNRDMARPTLEEMREIRNELYTNGVRRRAGSITRMPSTTSRTTSAPKSSSRHRHGSHRSDTERLRHRRRATETNIADYVYAPREGRQRRRESEEEDDDLSMIAEEPKAKEKKIRVVYVNEERPRRHISRDDERYESRASSQLPQRTSSRRSPSSQPLDILKRTLSTRDVHKDRPLLRRSHTSSSAHTSKAYGTSVTANPAPLIRRSTFMGLFAPTPAPPRTPPRV